MRPDDHKKKKNEQYKKKHGIKSTKQKAVSNQNTATSGHALQKSSQAVGQKVNNELESDEEQADVQRQFSRRKVESNWHRYELEEDASAKGENLEPTGADFHQLLSQKASSLAQFRFKEEQLWEAVELKSSPKLSINCTDLLSAVVCVPLHQRLGVDSLHFEKPQLDKFVENAEECNKSYMAKCAENKENTDVENILKTKDDPLLIENYGSDIEEESSDKELESVLNEDTLKVNDHEMRSDAPNCSPIVDNISGAKQSLPKEKLDDMQVADTNVPRVEDLTDDLDALLGICDHSQNINKGSVPGCSEPKHGASVSSKSVSVGDTNKATVTEPLEDQLDELLNQNQINETRGKESSVDHKTQVVESTTSKDCEKGVGSSLEDWLDDILDD